MNKLRITVFMMVLVIAVWQDLRTRTIERNFLWRAACVGGVICMLDSTGWIEVISSCSIGVLLLVIAKVTGGGIGEGDGWFFVVTGLVLRWEENLQLFVSGVCVCFLFCLPLAVWSIVQKGYGRKRELPFLPFLLPGGIFLAIGM